MHWPRTHKKVRIWNDKTFFSGKSGAIHSVKIFESWCILPVLGCSWYCWFGKIERGEILWCGYSLIFGLYGNLTLTAVKSVRVVQPILRGWMAELALNRAIHFGEQQNSCPQEAAAYITNRKETKLLKKNRTDKEIACWTPFPSSR